MTSASCFRFQWRVCGWIFLSYTFRNELEQLLAPHVGSKIRLKRRNFQKISSSIWRNLKVKFFFLLYFAKNHLRQFDGSWRSFRHPFQRFFIWSTSRAAHLTYALRTIWCLMKWSAVASLHCALFCLLFMTTCQSSLFGLH